MSYSRQPNLMRVENPAVPPNCATSEVFVYPQPSSLNYGARPNTMLYGTAPYMAGKGAPQELVDVADELRPQSTSQFNKALIRTYEKNYFPLQKMDCSVPLRTMSYEPASTRAERQNELFLNRY
jgi:hypothetical protein